MACQTLCSPSCRAHGLCSHAGSVSLPEELLHCTPRWINKEEKSQTLFTWRGGKMRSRGQRWRKSSRGSQGENNLIKWEKTEWCGRESESSGAKGEQCPGLTRAAESAQSQQRRPADLLLYRTGSSWCVPPRRHAFHTITSSSNNTINEHLFFFYRRSVVTDLEETCVHQCANTKWGQILTRYILFQLIIFCHRDHTQT